MILDKISDLRAETLLEVVLDNEYDLGEAGLDRIMNGVKHQSFVVRAHAVNLLVAAIAGSHASGHDH